MKSVLRVPAIVGALVMFMPLPSLASGAAAAIDGFFRGQREASGSRDPSERRMEYATSTGGPTPVGSGYVSCAYSTSGGFKFSVNVEGYSCPYSVEVDPGSMRVRVR